MRTRDAACIEGMKQIQFSITADILAPAQLVWSIMTDVERWSEWTPSISRLKKLSPAPLQIGSRVRIHQPRLPPAFWRVTELNPGRDFTWVSVAPGARVTARHAVEETATGCRATLSIRYQGWLGRGLGRLLRNLNERYLAMEARGLKMRSSEWALRTQLDCDKGC